MTLYKHDLKVRGERFSTFAFAKQPCRPVCAYLWSLSLSACVPVSASVTWVLPVTVCLAACVLREKKTGRICL